jgi:2-oxoglutarate ferredoxin oxidoreductase subunit delta
MTVSTGTYESGRLTLDLGGSIVAKGRVEISEEHCKGCELCISVCPRQVLKMAMDRLTPRGYHPSELVDPEGECTGCAICAVVCPEAAITVYRMVPASKAGAKKQQVGGK